MPASLAARLTCPDVVSRPVDGLSPSTLTVAWLATSRSLAVAAFVDAAHAAIQTGCEQPECRPCLVRACRERVTGY